MWLKLFHLLQLYIDYTFKDYIVLYVYYIVGYVLFK